MRVKYYNADDSFQIGTVTSVRHEFVKVKLDDEEKELKCKVNGMGFISEISKYDKQMEETAAMMRKATKEVDNRLGLKKDVDARAKASFDAMFESKKAAQSVSG